MKCITNYGSLANLYRPRSNNWAREFRQMIDDKCMISRVLNSKSNHRSIGEQPGIYGTGNKQQENPEEKPLKLGFQASRKYQMDHQ